MLTTNKLIVRACLYAVAMCATLCAAYAQTPAGTVAYPSKPVRLITTYPPGGASDIMARIIAQKLGEIWGQTVIVENKSGANGSIGLEYAARQTADGTSFVIGNMGPVSINPLITKVPYDIARDFLPISMVAISPTVLVINANSPAQNLKEFIAFARANPGKVNFGTAGPGTLGHLGGEMMKRLAGIEIIHVPYKGGVLAIQDLLGGHVQMVFADPQPILQHIRAGKARPLAVTSAKRLPIVAEVPTFAEAGLPGFVAENWWGAFLPVSTPKTIADKLQEDLGKAMNSADIKQRFEEMGVEALSGTPEALRDFVRAESEKWGKLVQEAGIRGE
jgi:tripartite-type tricarboxylate transporter receptor subunit TctC